MVIDILTSLEGWLAIDCPFLGNGWQCNNLSALLVDHAVQSMDLLIKQDILHAGDSAAG